MSTLLHQILLEQRKTVSLAESCTGGLLSHAFTKQSGSSSYFLGSLVAYSNFSKQKILGVKEKTLKTFGAVSSETVQEMLLGVQKLFGSDCALAVSGICGPTSLSPDKPVGLVHMGILFPGKRCTLFYDYFDGSREEIMNKTVSTLLKRFADELSAH